VTSRFAVRKGSQYRIQDCVKSLSHIFDEKPQHEVAVLLQQHIFAAIAPVSFDTGQM
jgi:hypothetical protein